MIKKWVKEGNPCRSLFPDWGEETEASRAADANRELTEDYNDPDEMHPSFLLRQKDVCFIMQEGRRA